MHRYRGFRRIKESGIVILHDKIDETEMSRKNSQNVFQSFALIMLALYEIMY